MKTYDEIKDIIVNQLGITNQATYVNWVTEHRKRPATQEEVDLLGPDLIDNNAFWRVAEELFQTDPVSNCQYTVPFSIEETNRRNLHLYHIDGFTGLVQAGLVFGGKIGNVLEIGPGYGAFRDWFKKTAPEDHYYATDVYPRIPEAEPTQINGLMSEKTKERQYNLVIASNVFQHLSVNQRRSYYRDIANCLVPNGLFAVTQFVDNGAPRVDRDSSGRVWLFHYGQHTQIQRRGNL